MYNFAVHSQIHEVATFSEFVDAFGLNGQDLLFTNKFTYHDYIETLNLPCQIMIYENYSDGEPSDEMVTRIIQDLKKLNVTRVIGIGWRQPCWTPPNCCASRTRNPMMTFMMKKYLWFVTKV